mmetsp:Transcript_12793/g.28125  ORF Transcript_12793/g.28125 Transcript_12793/m.28125 type:complete len:132 (-) Transcript_12793:100-495(-)
MIVRMLAQGLIHIIYSLHSLWAGGPEHHRGITWYWRGRMIMSSSSLSVSPLPPFFPTLYIYSQQDSITHADKLDELIEIQRQQLGQEEQQQAPMTIQVCKLEDSQHVLHYRKYPQEYQKAVDRFLEDHIPL